MITFLSCVPVTMKPPMRTLSPVSTRRRVEIFASVVGAAVRKAFRTDSWMLSEPFW